MAARHYVGRVSLSQQTRAVTNQPMRPTYRTSQHARANRQFGFSIVELGIVLVIIAVLVGMVLGGRRYIDNSNALDVVTTTKDLMEAVNTFRTQNKYWPGDLPGAVQNLPATPAVCNAGNGNGVVEAANNESRCAIEHLFQAGLIKAAVDTSDPDGLHRIETAIGPQLRMIIQSDGGAPARNQLVITAIPCSVASQIDQKIDDDNITTGRATVTAGTCITGNPDETTTFSIGLN
jgi:type II secretory pathway pseudopilin PulG